MSSDTTARTLAPSEEALDTPLNPPPLGDVSGSATGLSGDYPDGTLTHWLDTTFRTHHAPSLFSVITRSIDARESTAMVAKYIIGDQDLSATRPRRVCMGRAVAVSLVG